MGAKAGGKIDSVLFVCVCVCVCVRVCPPNFGMQKGVQAKHTFKAGRAGRPGGAQNLKEVPRGGSAGC